MSAILMLISCLVATSKCIEEQPVDLRQCSIDPRVSTLRCVTVPLELVQDALNQSDLTSVHRIDIFKGRSMTNIDGPLLGPANRSSSHSIREIKIVDSGLVTLSESSFNGLDDQLESVDLSWNDLMDVPEVVLKLGKLRHLDLSHNKIFSLPPGSSFNSLNALATLKLNGNRLGWTKEENEEIAGQKLSLLSFNLEPLTDTLETLELSDNGMTGLPMQFQGRSFARLRHLDLSHNPIKELPEGSFSEMEELEVLNLEHTGLRTLVLADSLHLKLLQIEGNPLHCDCHARWLWGFAKSNPQNVMLPKCATPYSAREIPLANLAGEDLCELLPGGGKRPPRFYRLSQKDEVVFPPSTFSSLALIQVQIVHEESAQVSWGVKLDYYYTDYDWAIIYRQIGVEAEEDQFYQTRLNLKAHLEENPDWFPKSENLTGPIGGLSHNSYYEVCLAVVEHSTIYYVHRNLCSEVSTSTAVNTSSVLPDNNQWVSTKNLSIVPSENSLTLAWQIAVDDKMPGRDAAKKMDNNDLISVIRQISIREFGSENATQLFVLEDFNRTIIEESKSDASRFYTLPNLTPDSSYVVCFDTLENSQASKAPVQSENCREIKTLKPNHTQLFPFVEVAAAAIVSAVVSAMLAALCCYLIYKYCHKKPLSNKGADAENALEEKLDTYETNPKLRAQLKPDVEETPVEVLKRSPSARSVSMSPSIATTYEPELQMLNTEESNKETEEDVSQAIMKKSKFAERYATQNPKDSNNNNNSGSEEVSKNLRFWKACLSNTTTDPYEGHQKSRPAKSSLKMSDKKETATKVVADKFAETQEYLRRPNVLYPPWPSVVPPPSQSADHFHTLPHNTHYNAKLYPPEMFGPGSYHTIAHYQMYKRPYHHHHHHVDFCPHAAHLHHQEVYHNNNNKHFMSLEPPHDYAQTLGRTRRESPMATKAIDLRPAKLKKMIKAKLLIPPHNLHHHHDHVTKMLTWSPYSSHLMYNDLHHHHHHSHGGGKSLDELRF